ncbi:hypothetical protein Clacol_010026 [Clathrus columnatus]|uniref:Peptidase A1 domain-containing protein n=1 Tax=Clathrus columnatus TaxID=1419009 RepID=A0AAV5ASY7_9AGAM|nr:hypothetical protein Clacol_010026 [Clathrus columnatus]
MSSEFREIILLNDDPSITYIGEWTAVQSTPFGAWGDFGSPFSPTLHSSSIGIVGAIDIANYSTNPDPTWECYVNGVSLGPPNLIDTKSGSDSMCSGQGFLDGENELVVNVTSKGMPFYFDRIPYQAAPSVSLENTLIKIQNPDPAINYISGWSPNGIVNQTSDPNSLISIQLSWYAYLAQGTNGSSGEYSIDGDSFTPFEIPGVPSTSPPLYNQVLFDTSGLTLEMGTHVLLVKYTGTSRQGPLTLDFLLVKNGSFASSPTSSSGDMPTSSSSSGGTSETKAHASNPTSPVNQPSGGSGSSKSNVGAIIGGVVGSIFGVLAIIIFFVWLKCRWRRSHGNHPHGIMPFLHQSASEMPMPPLQTSQIPKKHIQLEHTSNIASTEYADSDSLHPASLFIAHSGPPAITATVSGRPLSSPVLATHVTAIRDAIPIRHEDSGICFRPSATLTTEGFEIPPTYTEQ